MDDAFWGTVEDEFKEADFDDQRLVNRALLMVSSLKDAPKASLPEASKTIAKREAAYRFLGNHRVTLDALTKPHRALTVKRCKEAGTVYAIHDSSEFTFAGEVRGKALGRMQGKQRGFLGHFALAVNANENRTPLGVLGIQTIVRDEKKKAHKNTYQQKKDGGRESLRWGEMVNAVEEQLAGVAAIHVMDSEADIYELLSDLTAGHRRFVIRCAQDRSLVDEGKLFDAVSEAPVLLEREVHLSARHQSSSKPPRGRRHPSRPSRTTRLTISSRRVTLRRPKTTDSAYAGSLDVNVVRVNEPAPPDGQEPVQWMLVTSESVGTANDVAKVVDAYRARWTIEEYFKALKTGCAYEGRQLRSVRTLTNLLGILSVIAWRILLLRAIEREAPQTLASTVLEPVLLEALAARLKQIREPRPLPLAPTVADVMWGISRLGGHVQYNGNPGWQVLWRGFQELLIFTAGFCLGRSSTYSDHS